MSDYVVSDTSLTAVADAIRTKGGTSAALAFPTGFADAIAAIPSGGGGASNIVTGTFKGTTSGVAMDVNLAYTGNGWPFAFFIYPSEGAYNEQGEEFYPVTQRYATDCIFGIKSVLSTAPAYNGDTMLICRAQKSSATNNASIGGGAKVVSIYEDASASSTNSGYDNVKIKSNNKLSVYITGANNYGFMANVEYTYYIIYSA